MTLDELLASPDYQSAAPDDRMRHIDEWAVDAKKEFPDEAKGLDEEIPKLRAREYVSAAMPTLGLDPDTSRKYRDLYLQARRPEQSNEPQDWQRYDEEYKAKDTALASMSPEERLKFAQFGEVMDRAGKHFQTGEEARNGYQQSELDYGGGVKIPMETKTHLDRKEITVTYPDKTKETFEYALDEPPPTAERLRTFMVQNRPQHLGEWGGYMSGILAYRAANFGVHAANAMVESGASGIQFADTLAGATAQATGGGKSKQDAAITMPLFVEKQTGPDGQPRWVKRAKPEFLGDMPDEEFRTLQRTALNVINNQDVSDADLDKFYMNPILSKIVEEARPPETPEEADQSLSLTGEPFGDPNKVTNKLLTEQTEAQRPRLPEGWLESTQPEQRDLARRILGRENNQNIEARRTIRPFDVDPGNLLATQEDQQSTDGSWWGAKAADWLGDKAFNIPTAAQAAGTGIPVMAAGIAGGPLAALPFAALMGGAEGNQAYEDVLQKNLAAGMDADTSRSRALGAGAAYAAVATVLEEAGGVFEAGVFERTIGSTPPGRVLLAFAPESAEESAQSVAQDLISNANLPEEQRKKASQIANDALEAGAGALSFGLAPAAGALRHGEGAHKNAGDQLKQAAANPNLSPEARAILDQAVKLQQQAQVLSQTGQAAALKTPPKAVSAPTEAIPATEKALQEADTKEGAAKTERAAEPVTYADEQGDATYQNGQWVLPDGTPAPNAAELEAKRQEYIQTGDMPEGMQPVTAPTEAEPVTPAQEEQSAPPAATEEAPEAPPTKIDPFAKAPEAEPTTTQENAVPIRPATEMGAHPSGDQSTGGQTEGAGVGPSEQGNETAPPSQPEEANRGQEAPVEESAATAEPEPQNSAEQTEPISQKQQREPAPAPQNLAATQESRPETPAKEKKARIAKKLTPEQAVMKTREFKTNPRVEHDFIGQIMHAMGGFFGGPTLETVKGKTKLADKHKGEWNWYQSLLEDKDARTVADDLFSDDAATLDDVAQHFGMSNAEVGEKVADAIQERLRIAKEMKAGKNLTAEEQHMQGAEEQRKDFEKATEKGKDKKPVTTWELNTGDQLDVDGETVTVAEMTPDGDAILKDGTRFGRQTLQTGDVIWVEKGEGLPKFSSAEQEQSTQENPENEAPQPNPVGKFSAPSRGGKIIGKGVSKTEITAARKALTGLLPNATTAWSGTRAELEKHLQADAAFRWKWKKSWKAAHPAATDAMANDAFSAMLKTGLNDKEGFTFAKKTYLIEDQIAVREADGTPANAARRVLIHEDAHEGLQHLRDIDEKVNEEWAKFRDAIPTSELDDLAKTKYPDLSDWRNSPSLHDEIADEWLAAKIADIEKRGQPAPGSLVGKIIKWLKSVIQRITGDDRTVTDQALIDFMDAARMARFRDRAEATANGLRQQFSATDAEGDMSPRRVMETQVDDREGNSSPPGFTHPPSRFNLMSEERQEQYKAYEDNPDVPAELKKFSQFLGNPSSNVRLRQSLGILIDYARNTLGGIWGETPEVTPENTEKAWDVVKDMLTNKDFAKRYQQEFQERWSPQDTAGRPVHQGDAAAAVLQMEVMDYAVRLADETGDTKMMSLLYPFANDMILSDYQSISGAGRMLQVRSMAAREAGVWTSLRNTYGAIQKAAEKAVGSTKGLKTLTDAVDTTANQELADEVNTAIDEQVENTPTGEAVTEAVANADEYDLEGIWPRILSAYEGEERADLYDFWQTLVSLDRDLQVLQEMEAQAGSQIKASKASDVARHAINPEKLKQGIAEKKAKLLELLGKFTKQDTSAESKEKRKSITRDPRVKRAIKALSETAQAKKMIERFENRNKRLKRDKPAWRKGFEDQVKNPKGKEDFVKAMIAAGVTEQTANRLFDVSAQLNKDRSSKPRAVGSSESTDAERELKRYYEEIEKAEGKQAAMQAKIATQQAKAQAKAQNKSQAEAQREAQEAQAEEERKAQKRKADLEAYYAEIEAEEGKEAAVQTKLANDRAKAQAKTQNKAQAAAEREEEKRAMDALRELNRFQTEAERIITAYGKTKTTANPSKLRELRKQYREGKIDRDAFVSGANALGIKNATANHLANITEEELARQKDVAEATTLDYFQKKVTGTYKQSKTEIASELAQQLKNGKITQAEHDAELKKRGITAKAPKMADARAFISSVARQITQASVKEQEDPTWKRQTIINALLERGMTEAQAEDAANKLTGIIDRALKEGQAKAAIKALKNLKKSKKIDAKKLAEAIRTRGIDPLNPNPVVAALAKEAGYEKITPEQFRRLAELDVQANTSGPHLAAKAYRQIGAIEDKIRPRKTKTEIAAGAWVYSALSSLGVWFLNWWHPIYVHTRRLGTDIAGLAGDVVTGKTASLDAPHVFARQIIHWFNAMGHFATEAKFALKNDAYANKVLEMFQSPHRMHQEMLDAAEAIKTGNPAQKIAGVVKLLFTSTSLVGRSLASADQAWGTVMQHSIIQNEAMRMLMHKGGLSAPAAATVLDAAVTEGKGAMAKHLSTGADAAEAKLVGLDAMQDALTKSVASLVGHDEAEEITTTAQKEPSMELGNRKGEKGGWFDVVNGVLEGLKAASTAILNRLGLPGRMIVGFPSVGANVLNRSAYFVPGIGLARYLAKKYASNADELYTQTMATEGQARMRLIDNIIGTTAFVLLGMLMKKKPEEEGLHIAGDGPSNKSLRDAWEKIGHKPGHLEWVGADGKVHASVSYTRGGLDSMAAPLTFLGAMDDLHLEGKKADKIDANFAWAYAQQVVSGTANQARFFGMKNLVGGFTAPLTDKSVMSNVAYTAAPFVPWSGAMKSVAKLFTGEQDKTSWQSAFLAQMPIVPAFMGRPALNFLGDQVGPNSDGATGIMERLEYAGAPVFAGDPSPQNLAIYRFLVSKGIAPNMPMRGALESANGFVSDQKWATYVKTRGRLIKTALRENMGRMQFQNREDASEALETLSRAATREAKKTLGLK